MIKIDIDKIINELKVTSEWKRYEKDLREHLSDFKQKNFNIDELIWKSWILVNDEIVLIKSTLKDSNNKYWNWWKKEKLINKFINIYFREVKFCPYCWKIPLISYKNKYDKLKRTFDIDHIFPKEKFPHLTYNFYNLIPVCKICNNLKNNKNILDYNNIFTPYYWFLRKKSWKIIVYNEILNDDFLSSWLEQNIWFYELSQVYKNSQDTINDTEFILDKAAKINVDLFNNCNLNIEERKQYYFKNFYTTKDEDILKYSNWKLKRKLISEIKKD